MGTRRVSGNTPDRMGTEGLGWVQRKSVVVLTALVSLAYVVLAIRFANRIPPSLNPSAKQYFFIVLGTTVVVWIGGLVSSIVLKHRPTGAAPLIFTSLFGSFWCVISYGP